MIEGEIGRRIYETSSDRPRAIGDGRRGLCGLCVLLTTALDCHYQHHWLAKSALDRPTGPIDIPQPHAHRTHHTGLFERCCRWPALLPSLATRRSYQTSWSHLLM